MNNNKNNKNKFQDMFTKIKNPENIINRITTNVNMLVNSKKLSSSIISNFYKNISDKNINNFYKNLSNSYKSDFYKNISNLKNIAINYPAFNPKKIDNQNINNPIKKILPLNNSLKENKINKVTNTDINNAYKNFNYSEFSYPELFAPKLAVPEKSEVYKEKENFKIPHNLNKVYKNSIFPKYYFLKNMYNEKQKNYSLSNLKKSIQDKTNKINSKKPENNSNYLKKIKKLYYLKNSYIKPPFKKSSFKKDSLKITDISKNPEKFNFLNKISNIQEIQNLSNLNKEPKFKLYQNKKIYQENGVYDTVKLNKTQDRLKGNINISPNINVELKPQNMINDFSKIWAEIGERLNFELNASAEGIHF